MSDTISCKRMSCLACNGAGLFRAHIATVDEHINIKEEHVMSECERCGGLGFILSNWTYSAPQPAAHTGNLLW